MLAAEGLTRTKKGSGGGTFVTLPSADHVMRRLRFEEDLARLRAALSDSPDEPPSEHTIGFHAVLLAAAHNPLLSV